MMTMETRNRNKVDGCQAQQNTEKRAESAISPHPRLAPQPKAPEAQDGPTKDDQKQHNQDEHENG